MGKTAQHFDKLEAADMVPAAFIPAVKSWTVGDASTAGEGSVRTFLLSCGGMDLICNIQGCISPFEPSSMDGSTRKSLVLRLPETWDESLGLMEEALVKEVAARSKVLFGEDQSEDEMRKKYKPVTKKTDQYPRNLRCKLNTEGFYATRFWNLNREKIDPPLDYAGLMFSAVVRFRAIWIGADAWGLVSDATDLQLLGEREIPECPF